MTQQNAEKLSKLYKSYNTTIKLLIAEIEAKYQKFPIEIFNEIRSFNDHVARCYLPELSDSEHEVELKKAESHIMRILLDCYKFLNIAYSKEIRDFIKRDTRFVDLSYVDNGDFYPHILEQQKKAQELSIQARRAESYDKNKSLYFWQSMHNLYINLFEYLNNNNKKISWARKKFFRNKALTFTIWFITLFIGWMLGHFRIINTPTDNKKVITTEQTLNSFTKN